MSICKIRMPRMAVFAAFFFCVAFSIGCAAYLRGSSRLETFISEGDYQGAKALFSSGGNIYGARNKLLYLLDYGYILHLSGDYAASIEVFEEAKREYDRLYTKSLSSLAGTWLVNDYLSAYRGEDFERVMVNIFQALNYCCLGDFSEALVEARDVDARLKLINSRYAAEQRNVYREDAFARFLMGLLYEAQRTNEGYNDAFISYSKAEESYEKDYGPNYGMEIPLLLKENFCAAAEFMGVARSGECRRKYPGLKFVSLALKAQRSEVYLVQYNGRAPLKKEEIIPLVLPDGYALPLAFPRYEKFDNEFKASRLRAFDAGGRFFTAESEQMEDISAVAVGNLANRKARVIAKTLVSAGLKYGIEKAAERRIEEGRGNNTASGFGVLSSIFNIFSNRADLRCWQTLPAEIRVARLILVPGEYKLYFIGLGGKGEPPVEFSLGEITLSPGEKKFIILRTL